MPSGARNGVCSRWRRRNAEEAGGAEAERVAQRREAREAALASLRDALGLDRLPLRIECFDISNLGDATRSHRWSSSRTVARRSRSTASSRTGRRGPGRLRDDARSGVTPLRAAEVGRRRRGAKGRTTRASRRTPDLVLVDGGKGQLAAALAGLPAGAAGVPVAALAKQREEVFVPGRAEPLPLSRDDPGSLLLQRVRDEAHRFAVTFHRQRRDGTSRRRRSSTNSQRRTRPAAADP